MTHMTLNTDALHILIGGNTGIGKELIKASTHTHTHTHDHHVTHTLTCTQVLLKHNAKVYLAARSREKAEAAIADLKEVTGKAAI